LKPPINATPLCLENSQFNIIAFQTSRIPVDLAWDGVGSPDDQFSTAHSAVHILSENLTPYSFDMKTVVECVLGRIGLQVFVSSSWQPYCLKHDGTSSKLDLSVRIPNEIERCPWPGRSSVRTGSDVSVLRLFTVSQPLS
jgi:hypothetical protein